MKMISITMFQSITEKLEKITYFVFTIFTVTVQGVIWHPRVRTGVTKLQQIISKQKQANILPVI